GLPPGVKAPPVGRALSDMLQADELDAIYSPPRPAAYHPTDGRLARLFPEFRSVEQDYFRRTGAFPPQHLMVLRREVWEKNRSIAGSLTKAFISANDTFTAAQQGSRMPRRGSKRSWRARARGWGAASTPNGSGRTGAQTARSPGEAFAPGRTGA